MSSDLLDTGETELDVEGICHDAADGVAELVEKRKQQDDSPAAARTKVQQRCDPGLVEPRLWARRAVARRYRCPLWLRREQHGDGSDENEHCNRGEDPEPDDTIGEDDAAGAGTQT